MTFIQKNDLEKCISSQQPRDPILQIVVLDIHPFHSPQIFHQILYPDEVITLETYISAGNMAKILQEVFRTFGNVSRALEPRLVPSSSYIQHRQKSTHIKFYGLKNNWPKYTMMKDQRKRMTLKEYGPYKLRYNAIRKADILPVELREIADHEISCVPVDASRTRIVHRCIVTSKPRGNVIPFKMGRHLFRHLADYNKLCGVQRAMW